MILNMCYRNTTKQLHGANHTKIKITILTRQKNSDFQFAVNKIEIKHFISYFFILEYAGYQRIQVQCWSFWIPF